MIADAIDRRGIRTVGRKARLEIVFGVRGHRTVLTHGYAEPPFRIARPFPDGTALRMILAWSAPGIFGGDELAQHVHVEAGARVQLMSQSALQVHPSPGGAMATLRSTFHVEEDAHLGCEWDPVIPFAASRLMQRIDLRSDAGAALWWSDAFMAGRQARGERWRFDTLDHELKLSRDGCLDYLERYKLCPHGAGPPSTPWVASAAAYFGTVIASGCVAATRIEALADELGRLSGLRAGVDVLDDQLALVRLMGDRGGVFHHARSRTRALLCS